MLKKQKWTHQNPRQQKCFIASLRFFFSIVTYQLRIKTLFHKFYFFDFDISLQIFNCLIVQMVCGNTKIINQCNVHMLSCSSQTHDDANHLFIIL